MLNDVVPRLKQRGSNCYQIIETANKSHQCLPQGWEGTEITLLLPTIIPASPLFKIKCPSVLILQGREVGVSGHLNHSPLPHEASEGECPRQSFVEIRAYLKEGVVDILFCSRMPVCTEDLIICPIPIWAGKK